MYRDDTKNSGITFQCKYCKEGFTEKSCLRAHIKFVHQTFQLIFIECKLKKNIQGNINKHILWIGASGPNVNCVMTSLL